MIKTRKDQNESRGTNRHDAYGGATEILPEKAWAYPSLFQMTATRPNAAFDPTAAPRPYSGAPTSKGATTNEEATTSGGARDGGAHSQAHTCCNDPEPSYPPPKVGTNP